jgi:hypothetical protein
LRNYPAPHIADEEKFAPTDITVTAGIAKMKATNPKAVFIHASGPAFGTVLRGLKDAGIDVPVFTSSSNLSKSLLCNTRRFYRATFTLTVSSGKAFRRKTVRCGKSMMHSSAALPRQHSRR